MGDKPWKRLERYIAKRLGGRRLGATGRDSVDVITDWLAIEAKHRSALPQWLKGAVTQAQANAPRTTLPLVLLHEGGKRHDGDLVVLTLADFEKWILDSLDVKAILRARKESVT
jgi:hypothetical protein